MDFNFSKEEEILQWALRDFTERELMPKAKELFGMDHMPKDIITKMAELGFFGLKIPEEYGGQPATWVMVGLVCEELSKANSSIGGFMVPHYSTTFMISRYATEEAKKEFLRSLVKAEIWGCGAFTEPDCGSDIAAMTTRAVRDGDYYVLNGEKTSVTIGMQADLALTFAKTNPEAGARGVTGFLLPLDSPGIIKSRFTDMGWHPMGRASLTLNDVRIPSKYRMGEEGEGFKMLMGEFDGIARALSGLGPLGLAQTALQLAITHAKARHAFGQPIAKWEGVSFKISEAATMIEAARWLCYRALWLGDQGQRNTKEAAMAKWFAPQVAVKTVHDALLIHGHVGYSDDYPLEQMLRDVIGFEIGDGTAEIMKIIIARELMGKVAIPYR